MERNSLKTQAPGAHAQLPGPGAGRGPGVGGRAAACQEAVAAGILGGAAFPRTGRVRGGSEPFLLRGHLPC